MSTILIGRQVDNYKKLVGKKIKARRKELGITQDRFAELVGTDQALVSRWETGRTYPDPPLRAAIADVLKASDLFDPVNDIRSPKTVAEMTPDELVAVLKGLLFKALKSDKPEANPDLANENRKLREMVDRLQMQYQSDKDLFLNTPKEFFPVINLLKEIPAKQRPDFLNGMKKVIIGIQRKVEVEQKRLGEKTNHTKIKR